MCVIFVWWQSSQWSGNWAIWGVTKSITENGTKFSGESLEVSLSATKTVVNKKLCSLLSQPLSATDVLPVQGEYKLTQLHYVSIMLPPVSGCCHKRYCHENGKYGY